MKLIEKIKIYLTTYYCPFNKNVDKLINELIDNGKIVDYSAYNVSIEYKNDLLTVSYNGNYSNALNSCSSENKDNIIYDDLRPSKKTIIRFIDWLEKNNNYSKINSTIISIRNINNILNNK